MPYENSIDAQQDRDQQRQLLEALGASPRALRRDACGHWTITGSRGSVCTWGDGRSWAIWIGCRSAQHWTWTKKRLAFCRVTQDGDDEGVLRLHALPTREQAEEIRSVLGIRKRLEYSAEEIERRLQFLRSARGSSTEPSLEALSE